MQARDPHPGSQLGANQPPGPKLGSSQTHGCCAGQRRPRQPRQSARLGLKRKLAAAPTSSANDVALGRGPQPYVVPASHAGGFVCRDPDPVLVSWHCAETMAVVCHALMKLTLS